MHRSAWSAVYTTGVPYLQMVLPKLGVHDCDLEDVMQDVLVAAYRALDRYDELRYARTPRFADGGPFHGLLPRRESPLTSWLFGIAWRQVSHYHERAHRRHDILVGLRVHPCSAVADEPLPDEHIAAAERIAIVSKTLAHLDPDRWTLLILHDVLDVPVVDIAREQGINENTAQNRMRLAREAFTAAIRRLSPEMRNALELGPGPFEVDE